MKNNIIFFDGLCAMCNGLVLFILKKDKNSKMQFISLQSEKAKTILYDKNIFLDTENITTIYYMKNGEIFSHSSAILSIFYDLGFPWKCLAIFNIIPKKIRDRTYNFISRNRYLFFGKQESCRLLSIEEKNRIIE